MDKKLPTAPDRASLLDELDPLSGRLAAALQQSNPSKISAALQRYARRLERDGSVPSACEATGVMLAAVASEQGADSGAAPAHLSALAHLGGTPACWPCRLRLLLGRGDLLATSFVEELEPLLKGWTEVPAALKRPRVRVRPMDPLEHPLLQPPDLLWRLGLPEPLEEVARKMGRSAGALHDALKGQRGEPWARHQATRALEEVRALPWMKEYHCPRREVVPAQPMTMLQAAAVPCVELTLIPDLVEVPPGVSPPACRLVMRSSPSESGGGTRVLAFVPYLEHLALESLSWRLSFRSQDEEELLYVSLRQQRSRLGAFRLYHGEDAWQDLLDHLLPPRCGRIEGSAGTTQIRLPVPIPGWPVGQWINVSFQRR